ncbi:hypothetical protein L914_16349 [Phytophthora nicotianae]|uniref:Uncharacterized protein n=1 Tax=Phytophthora nicotianae TaxID=4792 RepID=W2MN27_PHYNI|nr:hypothetical protein L914_16349 [Phytophthora nicotianae]
MASAASAKPRTARTCTMSVGPVQSIKVYVDAQAASSPISSPIPGFREVDCPGNAFGLG